MGIKRRGNSAAFYANRRMGGRFVSTYLGSGAVAEMLAAEARERREAEAVRRAAWDAERAGILASDAGVDEAGTAIERAVRLILGWAGYRRHKRGEWRRSRKGEESVGKLVGVAAIMKRAQAGDEAAVPELRKAMDEDRGLVARLASGFGDLAADNREQAIKAICGRNLLRREGIESKVAEIREELAGPNPTAVERMLAERAAMDWLTLHLAERHERHSDGEAMAPGQREFHRRRVESRHRRYLASLRSLAAVRRLDLTAIQVQVDMRAQAPEPASPPVVDVP